VRTYEDVHIMVLRNDIEGLIRAAKDPDETIRLEAVKALRALNPPEAQEVLTNALSDSSANVRRAASRLGESESQKGSLRWLWIVLGTWGVGAILLALFILILMFSDGNFGHTGQIIAILVSGIFGVVLLSFAVVKLRKNVEE
jgi:hypothetical protein